MGSSKSKTKKLLKGEVSLFIENEAKEKVHSVVVPQDLLIAHSPVFRSMAVSGMLKRSKKIKLENVTVTGLQKILKYVEESSVTFESHTEALETLRAAREYQIDIIENLCTNHLMSALDSANVCEIFEYVLSAPEYEELAYRCLNCIDKHAGTIFNSPRFSGLKEDTVTEIVKRHSLNVASEMEVFKGVKKWAESECYRRELSPRDFEELASVLKPILIHIRFMTMNKEDLSKADVSRFYDLFTSTDLAALTGRPLLQRVRSSTVDTMNLPKRSYVAKYSHPLDLYSAQQGQVANGETFSFTLEMLKGKMCLIGVNLAIEAFVPTKTASCLYAVMTATNVNTTHQKTVRGAFLNMREEASLIFTSPLPVNMSERVVIAVNVLRAENVKPSTRMNEVEIIMPETKDLAIRILADSSTQNYIRCIFKDVHYFF